MKQAIAGVAPADEVEVTITWPSVAAMKLAGLPVGKMLGKLFAIRTGVYIFSVGNLFCLLSIPVALILYFKRIGPVVAVRYRLTNLRIVVERGLSAREERAIGLDRFDAIEIEVHPGDAWYDAGDLVFKRGDVEVFRLEGVSRPEAFRRICWKSHQAYCGVHAALAGV
jgi:hypothetical protein